ncbi:MAG: phage holin family protein [Bacilli bacterium]|nr:phage holin family protein [Bacilli bacterium]
MNSSIDASIGQPIGVILIVVGCYMLGEIYKLVFPKDQTKRLIPIVLAVFGAILGVIIYYIDKSKLLNVDSILTAILVGVISGTSSTGANQIIKQIFKNKGEENNE